MASVIPNPCQIVIHMHAVTWQPSGFSPRWAPDLGPGPLYSPQGRQRVCSNIGRGRVGESGGTWGLLRLRLRTSRGHFWCTELTNASYGASPSWSGRGTIRCRSRGEASHWGHQCFLSTAFVYVSIWWVVVYQALPFSFHAAELLTGIQIGICTWAGTWAGLSKPWYHGRCRGRLEGSGRWVEVIEQTQGWHLKADATFLCAHCHTSLSVSTAPC